MVDVSDVEERSEEIRSLIFGDKIGQALKRLMDFVRDFSDDQDLVNEVTVVSANHRRIEKLERQQRLDFDGATKERDKLLYQALGLMDSIASSL